MLLLFWVIGGLDLPARAQSPAPVYPISVLVLYTPQAAAGAGDSTALAAQIKEAFHEANTVFQNSQVNARVWLAQAVSVNYVESGSVSNDLASLQNATTSLGAQAQSWRKEYAADLVCLVTETGDDYDFYGLPGPSAENAFSIIRQPFLTGLNYFPVALSFNFGCQMEREYVDSAAAFPYAYGYSFPANSYGGYYSTVEAFSGERLPFFSNPDIEYGGEPAGVPAGEVNAADNALVLNQTAAIVADFRGTALPVQPPAVSLSYPANGSVFASGTNLFLVPAVSFPDATSARVDYYFDDTNLIASIGGTYLTAVWRNLPAGQHTLTVMATDKNHATTVSAPVAITVLPANDNFARRTRLTTITTNLAGANNLATAEPGEPDNNGKPPAHSLWWTWQAATNTYVAINVPSNSIPLNLTVFTGTNLANLSIVASNAFQPASPLAFFFRATAGTSYQITADGQNGGTGMVAFTLTAVTPPANDDFANRTPLTGSSLEINADNTYATHEPGEPAHDGYPGNASLWWTWTAPADGLLTLTDMNEVGDLPIGVYTGDSITSLTPVAAGVVYEPGSDFTFAVQAGVAYQIAFDDDLFYGEIPGPFAFDLDFITTPANDDFTNRTVISGWSINLTNSSVLATLEPGEPYHTYDGGASIWWSWTAPFSGTATVSTPNSYNYLDVYTGNSLATLAPVPLTDYGGFFASKGTTYAISASGPQEEVVMSLMLSTVQFTSPANGRSYFLGKNITLSVGATTNDGGITQVEYFANGTSLGILPAPFRMTWSPAAAGPCQLTATATDNLGLQHRAPPIEITVQYPQPVNDNFANRSLLQGTWLQVTNSNFGATAEPGEPNIYYYYNWDDSIWWQWTAPVSGTVTLSSATYNWLGVYTGTVVTNLTLVTNNYASLTFTATAGTTYAIGAVGEPGDVALKLSLSNLQITNPINGDSFTNGSTLELQVLTTATEAPINNVAYFTNDVFLGITTNPPYSLLWTNVPAAAYQLTAVATDNLGHDRSSPPVSFIVGLVNDDFTNRTTLEGTWISVTNSMVGATAEPEDPTSYPYNPGSIWWQWTAPFSGVATLASSSEFFMGVYTGNDLSSLQTITNSMGNSDFEFPYPTFPSISFAATAGETYDILCASSPWYQSPEVNLQLVLSGLSISCPIDGEVVPAGTNLVLSATDTAQPINQVQYFYQTGASGNINSLGVATKPPYNLVWTNLSEGVYSLTAVATDSQGETYSAPAVSLSVVPPNDAFANRITVAGLPTSVSGTTLNASTEPGEPPLAMPGDIGIIILPWSPSYLADVTPSNPDYNQTVWYTWTSPITGVIHVTLDNIDIDPLQIAVFTGDTLPDLALVADGFGETNFMAVAGTTYQICIAGQASSYSPAFTFDLSTQPANDNFAAAIPLAGTHLTISGNDLWATRETGEPLPPTAGSAGNSVWYSWTAPASGEATLTGATFGPSFAVYTGGTVFNLATVASSPPYVWPPPSNEAVTFPVQVGVTYMIAVYDGPGSFSLNLDSSPLPGNDNFVNRTPLSGLTFTVPGTTRGATSEVGEPVWHQNQGPSVWYSWTAPATGYVRVHSPTLPVAFFTSDTLTNLTLIASGGDPNDFAFDALTGQTYQISVINTGPNNPYDFTWSLEMARVAITNPISGALLPEGTNLLVETSTIDLAGAVTNVEFYLNSALVETTTNRPFRMVLSNLALGYYILSAVAADESGLVTTGRDVTFQVSPVNDNFANRILLTGDSGTLAGTNTTATTEPGEYLPVAATGHTIWWSWTAPASGLVTFTSNGEIQPFSPVGAAYDTNLIISGDMYGDSNPLVSVYLGTDVTNLSPAASSEIYATFSFYEYHSFWAVLPTFSFPVFAGQVYQISLDGSDGYTGVESVNFALGPNPPVPVNDNFAQSTSLTGSNVTTNGTTVGATLQLGEPDLGSGLDARTVWYSWTAPASGETTVEVDPDESGLLMLQTVFGVYAGSALGALSPVVISPIEPYNLPYYQATFYALAGTTYQIEVASASAQEDGFTLALNGPMSPTIYPTNAVRLTNGSYVIHVIGTAGASFVIQSSLNGLVWTTIDTDTLQTTSLDYLDTSAIGGPPRFYRVLPLDTAANDQPFRMLAPNAGPAHGFPLNLTGASGQPFLIQSSTNLVNWFDLTSGVLINNAFNFTDYNAPNLPTRFYRAIPQ